MDGGFGSTAGTPVEDWISFRFAGDLHIVARDGVRWIVSSAIAEMTGTVARPYSGRLLRLGKPAGSLHPHAAAAVRSFLASQCCEPEMIDRILADMSNSSRAGEYQF
ncbi:hypothetical protein DS843_22885 [Roseomonas genomospecies 6]|uniref:Uncharacterized protein n=1 Tax=Roseomonas genomospecies 6 TaxID=214106 RepID=A0A9W7NEL6_9PROT|nr:hypothetical protein DS843_22885 [Roseomonas genomospecies 6]